MDANVLKEIISIKVRNKLKLASQLVFVVLLLKMANLGDLGSFERIFTQKIKSARSSRSYHECLGKLQRPPISSLKDQFSVAAI